MSLSEHLPILMVVVSLTCAPLCLLFGTKERWAWRLMVLANVITLFLATLLLAQTANGVVTYALGNWEVPWGIGFKVDTLSAVLVFLFALISSICSFGLRSSLLCELKNKRLSPIYSLILISQAGFIGVILTDDLFNIFVLLEMASLAGYALSATSGNRKALLASYRYLIMGTVGALFFLFGIGYIYLLTGTLNLSDLASRWQQVMHLDSAIAGVVFIALGLIMKTALMPLHLWLPGVYRYAPSLVVALFSGIGSKASLYLLLYLLFSVFNIADSYPLMVDVLMLIALVTIVVSSYYALIQNHLKKIMAYSSIGNIGYIVLVFSLANQKAWTAGLIHIVNHSIIKSALFIALGSITCYAGSVSLDKLRGLGSKIPLTCAAISLLGLSLIGVPLTAGFISKWYLLSATLDSQMWIATAAIVVGSLFSIGYVWKILDALYFKAPELQTGSYASIPLSLSLALWLLLGISLYIGIQPTILIEYCSEAVKGLRL